MKTVGFEIGNDSVPAIDVTIYCAWNKNVLKAQGIDTENLAQQDTIIIKFDLVSNSVDVASTKGYSNNGNAIHKLSDF